MKRHKNEKKLLRVSDIPMSMNLASIWISCFPQKGTIPVFSTTIKTYTIMSTIMTVLQLTWNSDSHISDDHLPALHNYEHHVSFIKQLPQYHMINIVMS